ncbi:MAG: ROK family protein [Clostridia bacterium]
MNDTSMTTMKVKKINKNKVYHFIYAEKTTCKLIITQKLQMGLSTVTQNLKHLEEEGLIRKNGFFDSTGGRKADALEIVTDVKIAIGVAILKDVIYIVATNLYGNLTHSMIKSLMFTPQEKYYERLSQYVNDFISENKLKNILGVSIATQGIISKEGDYVYYGELLGNSSMKIQDFQKFIPYPCRLEHDSKAAANLELWKNKDVENAIVLLLNRNMGGALIVNGVIQNGDHMRSGIVEHLCVNSDGAMCYCGRRGCLETYCSVNALEQTANMPINVFFKKIEQHDIRNLSIWHEYLNYLALAIRNLSVIIDGKFIISGYLAPYFKEADIKYLVNRINSYATFPIDEKSIILGSSGEFSQAVGASLYYIEEFLKQI